MIAVVLVQCSARAGDIHDVVALGRIARVQAILRADPKLINARDDLKQTPLHIAAHRGSGAIVQLLLDNGADVNATAINNLTPLHLASLPSIVKLLLDYRADPEMPCADSDRIPLVHAARLTTGDEEDVRDRARQ